LNPFTPNDVDATTEPFGQYSRLNYS